MSVCAVMLVKDEADIIEATVRHLCTQVDEVLVGDNMSTDGTWDILFELERELPVVLHLDREVGYYQSEKTTALAMDALALGHEWVVPCDADEWWYSSFGRLSDVILDHGRRAKADIVTAEMFDHYATGLDDPSEMNPIRRLQWRKRERGSLPKVACRLTPNLFIGQGNHVAHYIGQPDARVKEWAVTIRHFPYRSADHFVRKAINGAAAYAATTLDDDMGGHWRGYGKMIEDHGEQAARDWYETYFFYADPTEEDADMIHDPAPLP